MDIVLVDDHPAIRTGLRGLVDDEEDLRVAATAATAREGFEAIADTRPDVALVDLHLPDDDGLSLCLRSRTLPAPPRVIIYSAFADPGLSVRALIAGAEGALSKSTAPRALLDALRHGVPAGVDARALRALSERVEAADMPLFSLLVRRVDDAEAARRLELEPDRLYARRAALLQRLQRPRSVAAA